MTECAKCHENKDEDCNSCQVFLRERKNSMSADKCIICGEQVPEGKIVCAKCDISSAAACTRTEKEYQSLLKEAESLMRGIACGEMLCRNCKQFETWISVIGKCPNCDKHFNAFMWMRG